MWSGSTSNIPSGWTLCNGSNGTPDLRNRFIVGAGSTYSVGSTGGSDTVTLTTAQMPSHNHSYSLSTSYTGSHSHTVSNVAAPSRIPYNSSSSSMDGGATRGGSVTTDSAGKHSHTISGSISATGSGQSHENRPPYYALCFIMKV
jgi:phage tail collar domain family